MHHLTILFQELLVIVLAGDHGCENHKEWTPLVKEFGKTFVEFPNEAPSEDTSNESTTEDSDSDWG